LRALFLNLGCERLDTLVRSRPIEIAQQGGKGVQREGRALTPSNDEPDCRIRAADDEERREVPHVVIVCDGEQHPIDITSRSVQRRIGTDWPQRSNKAFFFFSKWDTYRYPVPPTALEITMKSPRVRRRSDNQEAIVITTAVTA
jgi:hypothetical protein